MCTVYMVAHLCMWLCICVCFWIILVFFSVADGEYHELANACDIKYMFICSLKIRGLHV